MADGEEDGDVDGDVEGELLGDEEGELEADDDGLLEGDGELEGEFDAELEGEELGDGLLDGEFEGEVLGEFDTDEEGLDEGLEFVKVKVSVASVRFGLFAVVVPSVERSVPESEPWLKELSWSFPPAGSPDTPTSINILSPATVV